MAGMVGEKERMRPHGNPYRTDYPGAGVFCGRASEIALLVHALRTGRQSLAAIMAGRGMGKTSLALRVHAELAAGVSCEVHLIRKASADPLDFLSQIAVRLGSPLDAALPVESLVEAVRAAGAGRVTGIARSEGDQMVPRCELFRNWAEQNHPRTAQGAQRREGALAAQSGATRLY
jgi:hypothetical protein